MPDDTATDDTQQQFDRRLHAARGDLADAALRGCVEAERFTTGHAAVIACGAADLRRAPDPTLGIDTQLLYGETVTCYDVRNDFAWVKNHRDGYVGYLDAKALWKPSSTHAPTHAVTALRTFVYPEPSMKTPVRDALSMTSPLAIDCEQDGYGQLASGGWVFLGHLAAIDDSAPDHVGTALRFLGLPYRWGGKESVGLDCSALVQMALQRAGRECPRDSDMQANAVGGPVGDGHPVARGDLLFFPGHVAIALDADTLIHATAFSMQVCIEPIGEVLARSRAESGRGMTAHRRL